MPRRTWIGLCIAASLASAQDDGWNETVGVNLTLEEGFGARHAGMGISFAGFQTDANSVANAPAAMNDVDDFTLATAHAERFGEAKFDDFALLVPFEARSTLGFGIARYGVSDVEIRDDVDPREDAPDGYFTVADYLVTAAFARRWGGLDLGASLNLLYRQLDQDGVGMRADAMAQYTVHDRYRVSALLKGLVPSAAAWESDWREYEPTDIHVGVAARIPAPYFYGTLQAAWQSEGLFQKRGKGASDAFGDRVHSDPLKTLQAGNAGLEFLFDFGLAARFGVTEFLSASDLPSNLTFGVGYVWRRMLGLDYSFAPHPDLLASHRISLQFTPDFPRFTGRGFRPGSGQARRPSGTVPAPVPQPDPEDEEGVLEEPASGPAAPPAAPVSPVPTPAPAPAASPAPAAAPAAAPAQAAPAQAKPAAPPAPAPETLEEVEEDEE